MRCRDASRAEASPRGHPDPVFFREQTGQVVDGPPDVQVIVHAGPEQGLQPSRRL